jgi:hypothetical protein
MANYAVEAHKTSERRACRLAALSRSGYRYVRKKPNDDEIKGKLAQIAEDHHRWGFRKMRAEVTVAQNAIVEELKTSYFKTHGLSVAIDEYRPSRHDGDKEERMAAILEPKYDNRQIWHYEGGNCQLLEEELILRRPPHDDVKEALANAINIAVIPKQRFMGNNIVQLNVHPKFGGTR